MSFVYFVASTSRTAPTCLAYAFDGKQPAVRDIIGAGPGGNPGKLFGAGRWLHDGTGLGYFPDRQTWVGPTTDGVWIGFANDAPPTPEELARETQLRGHLVRLADGNNWLVPVARAFTDGRWTSSLPRKLAYDTATQTWTYDKPEMRFQPLWDIASKWMDYISQGGEKDDEGNVETVVDVSVAEAAQLCSDVLSFNYCVGPLECSQLGLFNDSTVVELLNAVVDMPTLNAWLKKKDQRTQDG